MAVDAQMVRVIAPEFMQTKTSDIQMFITFAELMVNRNVWGTKSDLGVTVLTAHYLTISSRKGSAGAVTAESVGDLSRSYVTAQLSDPLNDTSYGRWFLLMKKTITVTPLVL